jgi:hypothetical protein
MMRRVIALIPGQQHRMEEPKTNPTKALLRRIIESNGDTPTAEKEAALWIVLDAIYDDVSWLKDKVLMLERESIVHWAKAHKAETAVIGIIMALALMAWHDAYPYLINFLKLITPLKSMVK